MLALWVSPQGKEDIEISLFPFSGLFSVQLFLLFLGDEHRS